MVTFVHTFQMVIKKNKFFDTWPFHKSQFWGQYGRHPPPTSDSKALGGPDFGWLKELRVTCDFWRLHLQVHDDLAAAGLVSQIRMNSVDDTWECHHYKQRFASRSLINILRSQTHTMTTLHCKQHQQQSDNCRALSKRHGTEKASTDSGLGLRAGSWWNVPLAPSS